MNFEEFARYARVIAEAEPFMPAHTHAALWAIAALVRAGKLPLAQGELAMGVYVDAYNRWADDVVSLRSKLEGLREEASHG